MDQHILHGITDIPLNENGLRQAREAAEALKFTSKHLLEFGIIDDIIPEPDGGAHSNPNLMASRLKLYLRLKLRELKKIPLDDLVAKRYDRFRKLGVFVDQSKQSEQSELSGTQSTIQETPQ